MGIRAEQISKLLLSQQQLAAVGSVAIESTYLEQWVEYLIWGFLKVNEAQGKHVTHGMQMGSRLELLRELGKSLLPETDAVKLTKLVSQMKEANERRNTVIHGQWGTKGNILALYDPDVLHRTTPAEASKRTKNSEPRTLKATEVEAIAQELADLKRALIKFVQQCAFFDED